MRIVFQIVLMTFAAIFCKQGAAQKNSTPQLILSGGGSLVNNDFYTVNTIGDLRFDNVTGLRLDIQYGYPLNKRVHLVGGLGMARHRQAIRIHRHHSEPLIPPTAENFVNEISQRTYLNFTTGANILVAESLLGKNISVSVPIGVQNLLGVSRTIAKDGRKPESIGFQSWFFGVYSGFIFDYELNEKVSLRFSPTFTQFFTQYPHYTGSQHSFDVSVGVVFGF